ncbi:hypothetical protein BC830DRAFT_1115021 [Chytriomyces sp. MP71]|nr:hypothetical protein BC830DRAFT_1115021 [Chytriomyces sp. MP71]
MCGRDQRRRVRDQLMRLAKECPKKRPATTMMASDEQKVTTAEPNGKVKVDIAATEARAMALIGEGKRLQAVHELEKAVLAFGEAAQLMFDAHGHESVQYADAVFLYGSALFANAVAKSSPLGGEAVPAASAKASEQAPAKESARFLFGGDGDEQEEPAAGAGSSSATFAAPKLETNTNNEEKTEAINDEAQGQDEVEGDEAEGEEEGEEGDEEGGEDPVEVDMQIAWETLDLARVVYQKMGLEGELKMADVLLALGDVSLEQGQWGQAVEDFSAATQIKTVRLSPEDRELAEANYKLGLAHEYAHDFDKAMACAHSVVAVLTLKVESLKNLEGDAVTEAVKGEISEVTDLIQDIHAKIDDLKFQIEESKKAALAAEPAEEASTSMAASSASKAPVNDISGLVKSKKSSSSSSASPVKDFTAGSSSASVGMKRKADGLDEVLEGAEDGAKKAKDC